MVAALAASSVQGSFVLYTFWYVGAMSYRVSSSLGESNIPAYAVACAKCCRFGFYRKESLIELVGPDVLMVDLAVTIADVSGCKFASLAHRNPYNFSATKCQILPVPLEMATPELRDSIRRGYGFKGPPQRSR